MAMALTSAVLDDKSINHTSPLLFVFFSVRFVLLHAHSFVLSMMDHSSLLTRQIFLRFLILDHHLDYLCSSIELKTVYIRRTMVRVSQCCFF